MQNILSQQIEAIIFSAERPVEIAPLCAFMNKQHSDQALTEADIELLIQEIILKYASEEYPFHVVETGGGYQFLTKPDMHHTVSSYLNRNTVKRLSPAALESLSIIAYKQPISKSEVEQIRGVNSDYTIQKLTEKELIEIAGRSEEAGKPLLYRTTQQFLDYFGINGLDELPKLKEFQEIENQIGEKENIDIAEQN